VAANDSVVVENADGGLWAERRAPLARSIVVIEQVEAAAAEEQAATEIAECLASDDPELTWGTRFAKPTSVDRFVEHILGQRGFDEWAARRVLTPFVDQAKGVLNSFTHPRD